MVPGRASTLPSTHKSRAWDLFLHSWNPISNQGSRAPLCSRPMRMDEQVVCPFWKESSQ